jgi:hypothetical protein
MIILNPVNTRVPWGLSLVASWSGCQKKFLRQDIEAELDAVGAAGNVVPEQNAEPGASAQGISR